MKPIIHVATVGEESFKYGVAVMMQTLCDSLKEGVLVQFHMVDFNLKSKTRKFLAATASANKNAVGIQFLSPADSPLYLAMLGMLTGSRRLVSFREKCWLAKFVIPDLIRDVADCLFVDADIYCARDVYPLTQMDRGGAPLMAVADAPTARAGKAWEFELAGLDARAPYFNSGFMYFDLTAWRRENLGDKTVEVFKLAPDRMPDQSVFNLVYYGRWLALDADWNVQRPYHYGATQEFKERKQFIWHFLTNPKPWQAPLADNTKEFYEALDRTAFAGWRPNALYWAVHFRLRTLKMHASRWLGRFRA